MLIWKGYGLLIAGLVFGSALLCNWVLDSLWGEGYYSGHKWTIGLAMFLAAGPSWLAGVWLRRRHAPASQFEGHGTMTDADLAAHSLFFIPVRYWGGVLLALGAGLCALEFILR